ncbi:type III polyketide synthase [Ureibacillus acetophenoni]|uniref:15-methylpalmitoyl-4-hydroxy-2-pyrone synthase n=1 Tax=Ureibacillus acetophenoni TaxID=614649 RepID=A0A285UJ57_9BACL|nr:3-oxoacyl-[acyl-carrier-protein] synthase III C-terminal domain-containing protein [Ureibacillus acetophenoni]SOC41910.1 15-methylpalmitoyl-4-hydroxy-2-pyrone synthase [Ureibacillus acetophenoni]
MPKIVSVSTYQPPYSMEQSNLELLTRELFQDKFQQLDRLLKVFENGEIQSRQFCVPVEWYKQEHTFEERNDLYIELATKYSVEVIKKCLGNLNFLKKPISPEDVNAIFFVSSSGISTPSIDAHVLNLMNFSNRVKRIPIWGLGCAGGASGISRAFDYCRAHPKEKVLVVCVELCSLTFQKNDYSKSNLVGASLFADGVACALVCGDEVNIQTKKPIPSILNTASNWMPDSLDVMGWDIKNDGFHVIFSKDIPSIITKWLGPFIHDFLLENGVSQKDINHFIAHPGGKKVLKAYEDALNLTTDDTLISREVLRLHGNMSSPTVLYVLEQYMLNDCSVDDYGLMVALGPGFSGETVLLQWRDLG